MDRDACLQVVVGRGDGSLVVVDALSPRVLLCLENAHSRAVTAVTCVKDEIWTASEDALRCWKLFRRQQNGNCASASSLCAAPSSSPPSATGVASISSSDEPPLLSGNLSKQNPGFNRTYKRRWFTLHRDRIIYHHSRYVWYYDSQRRNCMMQD